MYDVYQEKKDQKVKVKFLGSTDSKDTWNFASTPHGLRQTLVSESQICQL